MSKKPRLSKLIANEPLISHPIDFLLVFPLKECLEELNCYFMAVNNVSFDVYPGETLGLVGESGCGKSTLARTILRLIPSLHGKIRFKGDNIADLPIKDKRLRSLRRECKLSSKSLQFS